MLMQTDLMEDFIVPKNIRDFHRNAPAVLPNDFEEIYYVYACDVLSRLSLLDDSEFNVHWDTLKRWINIRSHELGELWLNLDSVPVKLLMYPVTKQLISNLSYERKYRLDLREKFINRVPNCDYLLTILQYRNLLMPSDYIEYVLNLENKENRNLEKNNKYMFDTLFWDEPIKIYAKTYSEATITLRGMYLSLRDRVMSKNVPQYCYMKRKRAFKAVFDDYYYLHLVDVNDYVFKIIESGARGN